MGTDSDKKGKLIGREILWIKPSFWQRKYLMLVDGEQQAVLQFEHWFSHQVSVYGLGQSWVFNRKGWFRQEIVTEDVDREEIARPFRYTWTGGGQLFLDDGEVLKLKHNLRGNKSYWEDSQGEQLMVFGKRSWLRSDTSVEINPLAAGYAELPILVFLGFYLHLLHEEDAAVAATAAT